APGACTARLHTEPGNPRARFPSGASPPRHRTREQVATRGTPAEQPDEKGRGESSRGFTLRALSFPGAVESRRSGAHVRFRGNQDAGRPRDRGRPRLFPLDSLGGRIACRVPGDLAATAARPPDALAAF